MLEKLYNVIVEYNADIAICMTRDYDESGKNVIGYVNCPKEILELTNIESIKYMLDEKIYKGVCWGKLYKKELFYNLRFNSQTKICEDLELLYKVFYKSKKVVCIPEQLYDWRDRKDSVTKEKVSDKWNDEFRVCEEIIKFSQEKCPEIIEYARKRYIRINYTLICNNMKLQYYDNFNQLQNNLRKYKLNKKNLFPIKTRLKIFILIYFPWLYKEYVKIKNRVKG